MTRHEQAWQSGLVLLDETADEWNTNDWPPLVGGWRDEYVTVILDHPHPNDTKTRQTVVVLGGCQQGQGTTNSVLVLNLAESHKQWREGSPMNKSRQGHAAVVCNGGVYVIGGYNGRVEGYSDCIEQIDVSELLQSSLTASTEYESHWKTLTCRLSTLLFGCCAVAVHNRYIVVMGGYNSRYLSSVDIVDTSNGTVIAGPSMTVPRVWCASAVIGHRIFVAGGYKEHGNLESVEYLDFARPCENEKTEKETGSSVITFSSSWITHSDLLLSVARHSCAAVAMGSCLVVTGGSSPTVDVLDTRRNRICNLPPVGNGLHSGGCSLVNVANQVAVIGGFGNPSCATFPLMDKNSWCFRQLCEQQPNGWYHSLEEMGFQDADISPFSTSTSARKRARSNTHRGNKGNDEA